jgi:hypothetical protein
MRWSHIKAYVVSRWPFTAHALYQVSRRQMCSGRSGDGNIFVRAFLFIAISIIPLILHAYSSFTDLCNPVTDGVVK